MTTPQERAFAEVKKLAADFRANKSFFSSPDYQEQEARRDFIDKLFIALGWDVNHDLQKSPYEQEVKVERGVHVSGARKRADYAFYILPKTNDVRLFVEAKKPHGELATPDHCFQTIRYGWNAGTPLAVLTSFARLQVLDCRFKPDIDTAMQRAVKTYDYGDYADPEKFAEIFHLLSRDAVAAGSLEKFAATLPKPRGKFARAAPGVYKGMDDAFLEELDEHRYSLAHMFKDADASLDGEALTEITQRALDRLVFIRFLEDRLIEPEPVVSRFGEKGSAWADFLTASRRLDGIYNGIVFKEHSVLDSPGLKVDDKKFTAICRELSHEHSPYDFNIIPIHILGSIYERFLGKVITAGDKRARVEEKPEVRKAGGVYYTPQYIVKYIVDNTVGKMIEGKTPEQIAGMRFADISCGSGSFLLGVFDTLLDYHRRYYNKFRSKAKKDECVERDGVLHLTLKKRREILLNNVFGVDIDAQAVEVAQLSLYLKLLEEETVGTAREHQREFHETILPSLAANIVCGNSLIGTDVLTGQLFAGDEERKLNPMNFEARFPEIMRAGGFDAVIGNPPYGYMIPSIQQEYFSRSYHNQDYQKDLYLLFLERFQSVLKVGGLLGVIVSNTWLQSVTLKRIRRFLAERFLWRRILLLPEKVFKAVVDTHVIIFEKAPAGELPQGVLSVDIRRNEVVSTSHKLKWEEIPKTGEPINVAADGERQRLYRRIMAGSVPLSQVCDVYNGVKPFEKGKGNPPQTDRVMEEKPFVKEGPKPGKAKEWKPLLRGSLIRRYENLWNKDSWILYGPWLAAPRDPAIFDAPQKIMVRQTGDSIIATFVEAGFVARNNMHIVFPKQSGCDYRYILAVMNSRLMDFVYAILNPEKGEALAEVKKEHVESLPVQNIDYSNPINKSLHDEMVRLVDAMLVAKKQLSDAKTDKDKTYYEQKCAALDRQIDDLVYKLYGLTDDEIRIVEAGQK